MCMVFVLAPSQLALIQKTQELSCKVNTLESEVSLHSRFQGSTLPEGLEARTRTASTPDVEGVSATEALDLQTALEASEHMVSTQQYLDLSLLCSTAHQ